MSSDKRKLIVFSYLTVLILSCGSVAVAEDISLAVGVTVPPYVIVATKSGMEYEIVSRALALCGHQVTPSFVPFGRMRAMIQTGVVQVAFPISHTMKLPDVFFSQYHICYRNVVVTLDENKYELQSASDLKGLDVVAFKGARVKLGHDFFDAIPSFSRYEEVWDQRVQIKLLFFNRADAIVLDINFCNYYLQDEKNQGKIDASKKIRVHELFSPSCYAVGFTNEALRDEFNRALLHIQENGEYDAIIDKFPSQWKPSVGVLNHASI